MGKNRFFLIGMTVLLAFAVVFAGCDNGTSDSGSNSNTGQTSDLVYIGVVAFNAGITTFPLSNNLGQAKNFINGMNNNVDSTGLCYAVSESTKLFNASGLPALDYRYIVTFTDGDDNYSDRLYTNSPSYPTVAYGQEYDQAKSDLSAKTGVKSYAIGFGTSLKETDLRKLVVNGGEYRNATSTATLNQVFQDIANSVLASSKNVVLTTQNGVFTEQYPKYFRITVTASQDSNTSTTVQSTVICKLVGLRLSIETPSANVTFDAPVTGTEAGTKINIPLNNLKYVSGGIEYYIRNIKVEKRRSQEPDYSEDVEDSSATSDVTKKIGVVIVLDCTTSLGSAFGPMKTAAVNFVNTLAGNPNSGGNPGTTSYTVTFNANGGSGSVQSMTANSGSSITLPSGSGLTRTGYTFGGWNTNAAGTGSNYAAGLSYTVNGNVTLYAKWNSSSGGNTVITLTRNEYGETSSYWQAIVELDSYLNGGKITAGEKYSLTYSFRSNVAINTLQAVLVDTSPSVDYWNALSNYPAYPSSISANTVVSGSLTFTVTATATNTTGIANCIAIQAGQGTASAPTLTFTTFSLVKNP